MIPANIYQRNLKSHLNPVQTLLDDPAVSEVMINGPDHIYFERNGKLHPCELTFANLDSLNGAITAIAQYNGQEVGAQQPILEGHLPDGSRIEAVLPPAAPLGPMVSIRRFRTDSMTMDTLLELGSITEPCATYLSRQIAAKKNILVSGGTGSGKTTLLNVLSGLSPDRDRVVVIEDAQELQLQCPHAVQLTALPGDAQGRGKVSIRDLFRATLRMRPDRIVIGEIRAGEALELIQAMTSGHGGCLSTIHASRPADALSRLETLALMSDVGLPLSALRPQIASAIDVIVQIRRNGDGTRGISEVAEIQGYDPACGYGMVFPFLHKDTDNA